MDDFMPDQLKHRYHELLQDYWNKLRGSRPFPKESEIDPDLIEELWPSCFLISIDGVTDRLGYRYSYLGKGLIEAYGDDANHPDVALKLIASSGAPMVKKFDEVRHQKRPVIDESEFMNLKHVNIKYRTAMLPLGTPDGKVTHILGCMRWKPY